MESQTKYLLRVPTYAFVYGGTETAQKVPTGRYEYVTRIKTNASGDFEYHTTPYKEEASQFSEKTAQSAKQIFDDVKLIEITITYKECKDSMMIKKFSKEELNNLFIDKDFEEVYEWLQK